MNELFPTKEVVPDIIIDMDNLVEIANIFAYSFSLDGEMCAQLWYTSKMHSSWFFCEEHQALIY